MLWLVSSPVQAQIPATVNLSLHKAISVQAPAIGDVVTYTIVVANSPGSTTATNVVVKDDLPAGGVTFVPGSATTVRGSGVFSPAISASAITGTWTIGSIAPGDSAVLVFKANVTSQGVWFNIAEIVSADQTDSNSVPNNQSLTEDDYDAVCFSVPILWYPGDEHTVTIPSGYDQIVWSRNGTPISTSAVSTSLAEVNGDFSLTIKSPGTYSFVTYRNGCPSTNCCDIQLIQGPYGSLGDYVFIDADRDGAQDAGETGIDGVTVQLYDQTGTTLLSTTVTSGGGLYKFDSLTDGSYVVKFITPAGYQSTSANAAGVADNLDSDAGIGGFTGVYTIDTSQPESSTARNNPTVDAGYYLPGAGLGDYVFVDANKNGIQDGGDSPIPGVLVTLYTNGVASATTVSNASGFYSFTGLTPGSSLSYSVGFTAPSGYTATLQNIGLDNLDSDADPITGRTQSVTLADGEFNPTLDAGYYIPSASLGDYVFADNNQNGIQDGGDTPIPGVVVVLLDGSNTPIASTTTNASGLYSFTGLTPGVPYSVSFVTPTGYTSTTAQVGGDDTKDSDANPVTGQTRSVTLAAGENNPNLDAGFYLPSAGLGDYVFNDNNGNGIQDGGDTPLAGVTVTLYVNGVASATTVSNASGFYSFTGLTPGNSLSYSVGFTAPAGLTATQPGQGGNDGTDSDINPVTGTTRSVTLAAGEFNPNLDAGYVLTPTCPTNYSLTVPNAATICSGASYTLITSTLIPGAKVCYYLTPTGGTAFAIVDSGEGVVVTPTTNTTYYVEVTLGNCKSERIPIVITVKDCTPAGLGDYVFNDNNGNGIQDGGDTPLAGVTVTLYVNGVASATTVSNASGFYSFTGLTPGNSLSYSVGFTAPAGLTATQPGQGGNDGTDSDINPVTGTTRSVTLAAGEFNGNLDAGYVPTPTPKASLGDYVFVDNNGNGIQDGGDTPLAGVTVTLYINGVGSATTVSNASGFYSFTGLTPGSSLSYSVGFTTPAGLTATLANQGGNDALDSDADGITGRTQSVTLAAGEFNTTLDAGYITPKAGLGDYVFNDNNGNGIQDGGDSPIPGVLVTLYTNGVASATTVSNTSGFYSFTGLTPGNSLSYSVGFTTPSGYTATQPGQGGNDGTDSDINPVTGTTRSVTLAAGEFNGNLDAGYVPRCPVAIQPPTIVCAITEICKGTSTTLTARGCENGTVKWSDGQTGATIFVSPTVTTAYTASCAIGTCTSAASNTITVTVLDPQIPTIVASATSVCPGTSVTLTASGCVGGVIEWSDGAQIGNSIVVTLNGKTTYTAQCRIGSCLSGPATKTIDVTPVLPTPTIVCSTSVVCPGETLTLTVENCVGTPVWNSTTATTSSIVVTPTPGNNSYTVYCKNGACISPSSAVYTINIVAPTIPTVTASADTVCAKGAVVLSATGCNGQVIWSTGQTGASITVYPTANISYYAQCKYRTCLSAQSNAVKVVVVNPQAPIITASKTLICSGEKVTLSANGCDGIVKWYGVDRTGASIDIYPTATTEYYATCKKGSCESDPSNKIRVTVNTGPGTAPVITASSLSVCTSGVITLTATGCANGMIQWSDGQTGPIVSVTATANNHEFYALCKPTSGTLCGTGKSNVINISVTPAPAPSIVASQTSICSGDTVTLTASGCAGGTVQWYGTNQTGASIKVIPTATTEYYAICKNGTCESGPSNKVTVVVNTAGTAPVITASSLTVCSGSVVSLTATGCANGMIQWSDGQTGPVVSVTVTPNNYQFSAICKAGSQCSSPASNTITVNVTPIPTPTVVCSTAEICPGEHVVLTVQNCQGIPYWSSTSSHATSITVTPAVTTSYTVYCLDGVCKSPTSLSYTITVTPVLPPTITASATAVTAGSSVTLTATGCVGEVIWSANDINGNNHGASIVVIPVGTQTYYAQCKYRECLSDPSITIIINPGDCIAKAGTLAPVSATVCGGTSGTLTIAATPGGGLIVPTGYSVLYILTKGAGLVVQNTSPTPSFTITTGAADYTIHTLVYNATPADPNYLNLSGIQPGVTTAADVLALIGAKCAALDATGAKVIVTSPTPPVLTASSLTACYGSMVSLTATGCEGGTVNWSDGSVGASIQKTVYADLMLTATCTLNGCTSSPSQAVQITVASPAIPAIATNKPAICLGETVSLTATGCNGGTYVWSDPNSTTGSILTVTPTTTSQYRVKCVIGTCEGEWSAYNTITVGTPAPPTISIVGATGSTTACFGAPVTLTAQGCGPNSYVTWSNNQVGQSITVSLASTAAFTARCCNSNTCKSEPSNELTVTVLPKVPQPTVVDKTNACPFTTVDLATAVTSSPATVGGVFEFYSDASLTTKVATPAAVGAGTYYVVEKTTNGCLSLPLAIHVQITPCTEPTPCNQQNPATANAGPDASICAAKTYQLNGAMGGAGTTAHWTTSGNGTFSNPYALNPVYTASAEDILSGTVTLTLSVSTNNAACPVATDAMILTIDGIKSVPTIVVVGGTTLCFGDSVILKAPDGAVGYLWNTKATTQQIVVKSSGVYSVQLLDAKGCSSVKSADVAVNVAAPVAEPLVSNLRNTCPSKIVDLTKALSTTTVGSSYIYRICECVTSNIITRPDSVCEGTYWIVEKTARGCVSKPAKVVVKVFNCASDTLDADVSIAKTVSSAFVKNGAPVTYTVTVSNAGPHTAHNIDVRDVLPEGLEVIVSQASTYTVSDGVIRKHIDSLKAGDSYQIVFAARVTKKGQDIVNKAEITYLDNEDTNPANNTSSVTVKDTTSRQASWIGLAKAVLGQPTAAGDSLINVSYKFVVTNFGDDTLHKVQVGDDLAFAFSPNTVQSVTLTASNGSSLSTNPAFTGTGSNTNLLDSASHLLPGASQTFVLNVLVKRAAGDTTKSFNNMASASALNSLTAVSDLSMSGGNADPDNDGDPTNNTGATSFTLGVDQQQGPAIGLALAVVNVVQLPDSSYNVTYKATIKNYGDVALQGISLKDSLAGVFVSPASYSVVGAPQVGAGSTLVANATFNGSTQTDILTNTSQLAVGAQDTIVFTVNVKANGNNGPFYSSATAVGHTADLSQTVEDISNNGFDPKPEGSVSTTVRFDLPKGLLGVAKSVGTPVLVETGVYDIPYTIALCNLGTVPLKNVQVVDNLSQTFGNGALIVSSQISVSGTGSVTVDPLYTGQGLITKMLNDSLSTLAVGAKAYLTFTVRVNVKDADTLTFYNTAMATAKTPTNDVVEDVSTAGTNDDPDNDLDPRNNSLPTPIGLNNLSTTSYIGLAMSVQDTVRQADGSFNVTYQIVVKNYGPNALTNVTISDSLSKVFNSQTGASFSIVQAPFTTSTGSALKLNPNFNGGTDPVVVLGDSTSTMAAGKVDTIRVVINVITDGSTTTFLNSAYGQAQAKDGLVSDVSTSGLNPDLNGNNNPNDSNEREATPLNLTPNYASLFIPEGFSPNGDGVNDLFVIRGATGLTVSLQVYNRWGHMVYTSDDYKNDWDGKPNTGIAISSDGNGLPDGTYYYVINTSDGRKFVRYMTINR
ncbi:hypothetical protein GCM10027190_14350 [Spirosoma areae]